MSVDHGNPIKRCAIYTRKSTNKRLDHDVNSLVTQREICSAYIKSQQYKNWVELNERYDDGGHSGSGLDRPALAKLMQDIEAGKVDAVIVYKIDRLTGHATSSASIRAAFIQTILPTRSSAGFGRRCW